MTLLVCILLAIGASTSRAAASPTATLEIVTALSLAPASPVVGETVTARFTVRNNGGAALSFSNLGAGGRGPDCSDFTCASFADFPLHNGITLNPGESYAYEASRVFWDEGAYVAQIVAQTTSGVWSFHGGLIRFSVGESLTVAQDLVLTPATIYREHLVFATMTLRNGSSQAVTLQNVGVGVRGPSCTVGDWACLDVVDFGFEQDVTLAAGESRDFFFWRMFHEAGLHFAQVTIQDAEGTWQQLGTLHPIEVQTAPQVERTSEWQLGVHFHPLWQLEPDRARLALAKSADIDIVRIAVAWRLLEKDGKGVWDTWYRDVIDQTIDSAKALDLDVYLMLSATPCWASSDPAKNCTARYADESRRFDSDMLPWDAFYPPSNNQDYADALVELINLYGDRVDAFEVWNEPNIDRFWSPSPDASQYQALLQTAYSTAKAAYPTTTILGGSLAGTDVDYLHELYELGAIDTFDALALHPYATGSPTDCAIYRAAFRCGIDAIRGIMAHHGDSKPIWLTEFGWNTQPAPIGVGELGQMAYFADALAMINYWEDVPVATIYNLVNTSGNEDVSAGEDYFGLFDAELRPKLAALWLQDQYAPFKLFIPMAQK